jgi:ABC-type phosphate/phosphonate transport system ATPase subunit
VQFLLLGVGSGAIYAALGWYPAYVFRTSRPAAQALRAWRIADERGAALLVVEQQAHMALEVADRAYVLTHGTLMLEGDATELRSRRDLLESSYLGEVAL